MLASFFERSLRRSEWLMQAAGRSPPSSRYWQQLAGFLFLRGPICRFDAKPGHVKRRQKNQGKERGYDQSAHHGVGHRPPEYGGRDGYHAKDRGGGGEQDWAQPVLGGGDDSIPGGPSVGDLRFDLVDQDHRVTDHHAN